jgi:hypothetical protein
MALSKSHTTEQVMKLISQIRTLLLLSGLIFLGSDVFPQSASVDSVSWQDTIAWLVPAFNQNAAETRSFKCGDGQDRTQEEQSQIVQYATDGTGLVIRQTSSGMYGDSDRTAHLTLSTLNPNVRANRHDLTGGGSCHWVPNAWFQIVLVVTDPKDAINIVSGGTSKQERYVTILFDDESMATRCAAALSHLITLAGGKAPKPPPF